MRYLTTIAFALLIGTIAAPRPAAARESCAARRVRVSDGFAAGLRRAALRCVRRSPQCPDDRLRRRIAQLRANAANALLRRCPFDDIADVLAPVQAAVFCAVLSRCSTPTGHIDLRFAPARDPSSAAAAMDIDVGWTGLAHDRQVLGGAGFGADLFNCGDSETKCDVEGPVAATLLGAPLPFAVGGVPVCVTLRFVTDVTGTFDTAAGDLTVSAPIRADVFLTSSVEQPCPICAPLGGGDPGLGDLGTCSGGSRDGLICRVTGLADEAFGAAAATSEDCPLASTASIVGFEFDATATTGTATFAASEPCLAPFASASCWCPGQVFPNACDDGVCSPAGVCEAGPVDAFCSDRPFLGCFEIGATVDCEDAFPGAGTCAARVRPCFSDPIVRVGAADPPTGGVAHPTLVGTMCFPKTRSSAVNGAAGFPGPGAFVLPAELTIADGAGPQ